LRNQPGKQSDKKRENFAARYTGKSFDAVVYDVTMPGIDGQTVSRIRAAMRGVVAVMSGFHMECTGARCVPNRHCTWLQKPFAPEVAVVAVETVACLPKRCTSEVIRS
jgi:DNA-binding response OmpR family regulator